MRSLVLSLFIVLVHILIVTHAQRDRECAMRCNDLRHDVLTLEICREAKKTLPKPKVGDVCSIAMEQGFSDVCIPLCFGEEPQSRIVQACRAAAMEMPRPTVRRWCEHGYRAAFEKTIQDLQSHFTPEELPVEEAPVQEQEPEAPAVVEEPAAPVEAVAEVRAVLASVPITLDEEEISLDVHVGESPEDAVVAFCKVHVPDEVAACIRQLLPTVLERLDEVNARSAAAADADVPEPTDP